MNLTKLIPISWDKYIAPEYDKPYFKKLEEELDRQYSKYMIYPPKDMIFRALSLTPPENVKVVILGQDPYHREGLANGLAFSISKDKRQLPPSLRNIFKEANVRKPLHGDLTYWANQGVLLLNTILTVRHLKPLSHKDIGWEELTSAILMGAAKQLRPKVFMLWGNKAKELKPTINRCSRGHYLLEATHPSAIYSPHSDFIDCEHFTKANNYLIQRGIKPIDWNINNEAIEENKESA